MITHYEKLNVSEKADFVVISAAYEALRQKWHPDKHPNHREKAERYMNSIARSFDLLSDPKSRAKYDSWLIEQRRSKEPASEVLEVIRPSIKLQPNDLEGSARKGERRSQGQVSLSIDSSFSDGLEEEYEKNIRLKGSSVHPWRRFLARSVDAAYINCIFFIIIAFVSQRYFNFDALQYFVASSFFSQIAIGLLPTIVVEPFLLYAFSTTPGKWLYGIRVISKSGTSIKFKDAFLRTSLVSTLGLGLNIPVASIVAMAISYSRLKNNRTTLWDQKAKTVCDCEPFSAARFILCITGTAAAIFLSVIIFSVVYTKQLGML